MSILIKPQNSNERIAEIEAHIDLAHNLSKKGDIEAGILQFKMARSLVLASDPSKVKAAIDRETSIYVKESRSFEQRARELSSENPTRAAIIVSDSLGLPRGAADLDSRCHQVRTYPFGPRISRHVEKGAALVQALCQRYATTEFVVNAIRERADCQNADVLIHIGLNDCVVRMFMNNQRIALGTLSAELRQKIVGFSQVHRDALIESDFDHTFTPLQLFKERLEEAVTLARSKGARSVGLATIVQPPLKFAAKTPQMAWNFARYNMAIYDVAKSLRCHLIDMHLLCWEHGTTTHLSADGMHLSAAGHRLMADTYLKAIGFPPTSQN
ncbi:SGNH/GDSL hydrolase family protein [Rhizobium sp. RCAM05350]|nr:SGNH/GDSL hydrolase family protein [Rhizobium sp. RCAM05350]